jgi:Ankyrin repeats (3 copies)
MKRWVLFCAMITSLFSRPNVLRLTISQAPAQQSPAAVERLLGELPTCSILRAELERGVYGSGIDEPYMTKMRQQGVQRALLEVDLIFQGDKPADIRVERRVYFRKFDGPSSQVSDEATLRTIEESDLPRTLDGIARSRVLAAPVIKGPDLHITLTKQVSSVVEFFADASLQEQKPLLFPSGHPKLLTHAVVNGDALGTEAVLGSHKFAVKDLDQALFDAVLSRYDNSAVIKILLNAGASVNARTSDGTTPLINAAAHPCNLRPLLDNGADLSARDKWGRNALELAREAKATAAIQVLQDAGVKPRSDAKELRKGNPDK